MTTRTLEKLANYSFDDKTDKINLPQIDKIYQALHKTTKQPFLLKFLPDNRILTDELVTKELSILQAINHPNILKYLNVFVEYIPNDDGDSEETYVYVLEHENIKSLVDFPTATFWESGLKTVLLDVLEGLRFLHNQNMAHTHLQPAQVLITDNGREIGAKLFYHSKAMRLSEDFLHYYEYQSPEQLLGKEIQANFSTDIWSFGVMVYEILTQETPFGSEKQGFSAQDMLQHIAQYPTPALLHTLIEPYRHIIWRCLQVKPKERFNNVNEIIFLLKNPELTQKIPFLTVGETKSFKGIQKTKEPIAETLEIPTHKTRQKYNGFIWLLLVLLVLFSISLTALYLVDNGQTIQKYYQIILKKIQK